MSISLQPALLQIVLDTAKMLVPIIKRVQAEVLSRSDRPVKAEDDRVEINVVNGIFIAAEVDWSTVTSQMGPNYEVVTSGIVEDLNLGKIFPPEKFERNFLPKMTGKTEQSESSQTAYCRAAVNLKSSSQSEAEIRSYLPRFLKEQKVPRERADPILGWLSTEKNGGHTFYDVVEFEIWCSFHVGDYLESKKRSIPKKLKARKKKPRLTTRAKNMALDQLKNEVTILATKLTETISEKKVYMDFYNAFKGMKTSPFILYIPKLLDLSVKPENENIKLGQKFTAKATIKNLTRNREFQIHKDFKIEVISDYFSATEMLPCKDEPIGYDEEVEVTITLKPIIDKITEKKRKLLYPVSFIVSSLSNHTKLNEKELLVPLGYPDLKITAERTFLPHKGGKIEVCFKVSLTSSASEAIPMKVKGIYAPDFTCSNPPEGEKEFEVFHNQRKEVRYYLVATRAGFPGYENKAHFEFSVGEWESHIARGIRMTVLPNWLDTTIAGITGFALILSQFYPGLIPSLTTEPNLATLSSSSAVIYLAFRVITWGLATQKKTS